MENHTDWFTSKNILTHGPKLAYPGFCLKWYTIIISTHYSLILILYAQMEHNSENTSFNLFKSLSFHFTYLSLPQIAHRGISQCKTFMTFHWQFHKKGLLRWSDCFLSLWQFNIYGSQEKSLSSSAFTSASSENQEWEWWPCLNNLKPIPTLEKAFTVLHPRRM